MNIPFALPDVGQEEAQAAAKVIAAGWLTSGSVMKAFEEDIALKVGSKYALTLNSATAGMHLALLALGIGPGDKVLVPTLTFAATAEVVKAVGADVVLVDCDPVTLNITVATLKKAWQPGCKAVIPVHFAGLPCYMNSLLAWARTKKLKVIEDAAHAFGAYHGGNPIGSLSSDATVFSFYATKCITTGEGGAVATNDPVLAEKIKILRLHGISRDVFDRYSKVGSNWEYDVVVPGWKYNLTDIAAAIGRVQIRRSDSMLEARRALVAQYDVAARNLRIRTQPTAGGHAHHLYPIWGLPDRNEFIERMKLVGVGCSVHFKPLHRMTAYAEDQEKYPNAEAYWQSCVSLPMYSKMSMESGKYVAGFLRTFCEV